MAIIEECYGVGKCSGPSRETVCFLWRIDSRTGKKTFLGTKNKLEFDEECLRKWYERLSPNPDLIPEDWWWRKKIFPPGHPERDPIEMAGADGELPDDVEGITSFEGPPLTEEEEANLATEGMPDDFDHDDSDFDYGDETEAGGPDIVDDDTTPEPGFLDDDYYDEDYGGKPNNNGGGDNFGVWYPSSELLPGGG